MVWKFYFESPRIHVIHEPVAPIYDPEIVELTCTTLDAVSNIPVPSYLHYDIDRESRHVALGLKPKRERIQRPLNPIASPSIFHARWPTDPAGLDDNAPKHVSPIDVDWTDDLFYICSPSSGLPFASFKRRGSWVRRIQKLALAQPFDTPTTAMDRVSPETPRSTQNLSYLRFTDMTIEETIRTFESVRELSVVCLPSSQLAATDEQDEEHGTSNKSMSRDEFGFTLFGEYLKQKAGVENRRFERNTTDTTRLFLALQERFTTNGKLHEVVIKKCVDIDGRQLPDGSYRRRKRGCLPRTPTISTIPTGGDLEFSFHLTEA